jgi:hypothetical protein
MEKPVFCARHFNYLHNQATVYEILRKFRVYSTKFKFISQYYYNKLHKALFLLLL